MAERRENSVLFSLKELRRIEDDRVKKEQDDAKARADADRAAKEAAERATRDAEERKRRDEEDRVRRIEEEKESRVREDHMRLQETERRARVEGEVRLQEERMRLDAHARAQARHRSPVKAVVTAVAVLVLVAGILGWRMYQQHQAEVASLLAERMRVEAEAKAAQVEFDKKVSAIQNEMNEKLRNAKSDEERARIRAEAAQAQQQARAVVSTRGGHKGGKDKGDAPAAPVGRKVTKHEVSDNPLEGL